MNTKQINTVTRIQAEALKQGTGYEIKQLKLYEMGHGTVSCVVESGRVGDEGTLLSAIGRYYGHFFVGKRGGIEAVSKSSHATVAQARKYPLIFGWRT